jgi:hypothetical protein
VLVRTKLEADGVPVKEIRLNGSGTGCQPVWDIIYPVLLPDLLICIHGPESAKTVSRDFRLPVFFINQLPLGHWLTP